MNLLFRAVLFRHKNLLQTYYNFLTLYATYDRMKWYKFILEVNQMDKNEWQERTEQMLTFMKEKDYQKALEAAEDIEWKKVKNTVVLCAASELYEYNKDYVKSRELLLTAYERSPESKKVLYRLSSLALKMDDIKEATECYEEFIGIAPKDPNQHILRYKILAKQEAPIEQQIEALENFKKTEYAEKWAFELAKLYDKAGMTAECIEECDDLILWFSDGKFMYKAMEMKKQYKPLTPMQQEKYDQKFAPKEEPVEEIPAEEAPVEEAPVEEVAVSEETPVAEEEEPIEIEDENPEELKSPTSGLSIQEILQDWEEKQKENAQMIQAEQERVQAELEAADSENKDEPEEEEESILPDDIRQLMEELETESSEIQAKKVVSEPSVPLETVVLQEAPATEREEAIAEVEEPVQEIKLGDTQQIMNAAKSLFNDSVVEEPIEVPSEVPGMGKFDTGFVVQGRYDLEAQSVVGTEAGLTEEERKLFSYFVPVHGMSEQLVEVLDKEKKCRSRYGTSRTGNIVVVGHKGSGKTVLAVDIVKAIQRSRKFKQGKIAIVKAEALNSKDISAIVEKLFGGALVIENASRLNKRTSMLLSDLMEEQTGELLVVLEDERKALDKMLEANPRFEKKFTSRVEVPVFVNDELVTFAQTYAKENGYKIDDMGILALYSHIDMLQRDEKAVTVADVKELVDAAIDNAKKVNVKHIVQKVFGKAKDESDRVILTEEDFKW